MNLEKIKKLLKSKKGIVITGLIVGILIIGVVGGILVNGSTKSNDIVKNNTPVTNNKKEDITIEKDKPKLLEKEKTGNEDKKEEAKDNQSNINIPENSTSSNELNNNTNKNNNQSSSSVDNSNSTITPPSINGSNNTGNNSNTSNGSKHTHNWNPMNSVVYHDEVGHWEDVVVKSAWSENIPVYGDKEFMICNDCGAELNSSNCYDHVEGHLLSGGKGSWREEWRQVQVGTNTINHSAVTEKKWVVDKAAWSETVIAGYSCSCGATK